MKSETFTVQPQESIRATEFEAGPESTPKLSDSVEVSGAIESLHTLSGSDLIDSEMVSFLDGVGVEQSVAQRLAHEGGFTEEWDVARQKVNQISRKIRQLLGGVVLSTSVASLPSQSSIEVARMYQNTPALEQVTKSTENELEARENAINNLFNEALKNPDKVREYTESVIRMSEELESGIVEGMMSPNEEVRMQSARLRKLIQTNIERLAKIEDSSLESVVGLGNGTLLFRNYEQYEILRDFFKTNDMEEMVDFVKETGEGGVTFVKSKLDKYFTDAQARGLSDNDRKFIELLVHNKLATFDDQRVVIQVDAILFVTDKSFTHENLHRYMIENVGLLRHWVGVWNEQSEDFRRRFLAEFKYIDFTDDEVESFVKKGVDPDQVISSADDLVAGRDSDRRYYEVIQEFYAFSSDNDDDYPPPTISGYEIK